MMNIFQIYIIQGQTDIFFPDTGYAIIGSLDLYSIFTNPQHIFSNLWLVLHIKSETTSQHPINIIDSQRHVHYASSV